jgi:hypothetical protein
MRLDEIVIGLRTQVGPHRAPRRLVRGSDPDAVHNCVSQFEHFFNLSKQSEQFLAAVISESLGDLAQRFHRVARLGAFYLDVVAFGQDAGRRQEKDFEALAALK